MSKNLNKKLNINRYVKEAAFNKLYIVGWVMLISHIFISGIASLVFESYGPFVASPSSKLFVLFVWGLIFSWEKDLQLEVIKKYFDSAFVPQRYMAVLAWVYPILGVPLWIRCLVKTFNDKKAKQLHLQMWVGFVLFGIYVLLNFGVMIWAFS